MTGFVALLVVGALGWLLRRPARDDKPSARTLLSAASAMLLLLCAFEALRFTQARDLRSQAPITSYDALQQTHQLGERVLLAGTALGEDVVYRSDSICPMGVDVALGDVEMSVEPVECVGRPMGLGYTGIAPGDPVLVRGYWMIPLASSDEWTILDATLTAVDLQSFRAQVGLAMWLSLASAVLCGALGAYFALFLRHLGRRSRPEDASDAP